MACASMRLDKFISHATGLSRTESRRAIKKARVQVNGQVLADVKSEVGTEDSVVLDDELLSLPQPRYFMLHKPEGYVCATEDGEHPTVLDLLADLHPMEKNGLVIAGRLDKDSTGLVLIGNDGQWIHRLTSPRHEHRKCYRVTLEHKVSGEDVNCFAEGMLLRSEERPTRPAVLKPLSDRQAEVIISEGRYHQIKRMFAARGNRVLALHREQIGAIILDPALSPGEYRPLSDEEFGSVL